MIKKFKSVLLLGVSIGIFSCGGDDDSPSVSDDAILSELTDEETIALCEESVASQLDSVESSVAVACYSEALFDSLDDPSLDCETLAAECIAGPVEDVLGEPTDCNDPEEVDLNDMDCTVTVGTLRTCTNETREAFDMIADGVNCENIGERITSFGPSAACNQLDEECPDF